MRKHTGKTITQRDRRDETIPPAPVVASATAPSAQPATPDVAPNTASSAEPASLEKEALAKRRAFIEALARQTARELFAEAMAKR